jgi:hypothetical protein
MLYLTANNGASFNLTADIFDFSGKMISSQIVNNQTEGIDISAFQSGLYLITLTEGNTRIFTQSFIVQ